MKIIFVVSDFEIGGITTALKNLTNELIKRGHKIDILNMPKVQCLPEGFNVDIRLIELPEKVKKWNLCQEDIKEAFLISKIFLLLIGVLKKILNKRNKWLPFIFGFMENLENYDVAIAFRQDSADYYVTKHKINAKRKVGFWHGDPDYMGDTSSWDCCVYDMDCIVSVSNAVCKKLQKHYPKLQGKLYTVYNLFEKDKIVELGKEYNVDYSDEGWNIITVSRLVLLEPKNHQRIIEICRKLRDDKVNFHWTFVGDGEDMSSFKQQIADNDLKSVISVIGAKSNPYPYIKQADLFVLTSTSESYGMVVMESLILGTPVVAGDYPALQEILSNNYGIRTKNTVDGIYYGIRELLNNRARYNMLKENCLDFKYSTDETYRQFLKMCGEQYEKI